MLIYRLLFVFLITLEISFMAYAEEMTHTPGRGVLEQKSDGSFSLSLAALKSFGIKVQEVEAKNEVNETMEFQVPKQAIIRSGISSYVYIKNQNFFQKKQIQTSPNGIAWIKGANKKEFFVVNGALFLETVWLDLKSEPSEEKATEKTKKDGDND